MRNTGESPTLPEEGLLRQVARGRRAADLLQRVADHAREVVPADGSFVERVDFQREQVEVAAVSGSHVPEVGTRAPYPGSLAQEVIQEGRPELVDNAEMRRRLLQGAVEEVCGECTALILPLLSEEEAVGALVLVRTPGRPEFSNEDLVRLAALSDLAALAIRRTLLLQESQGRLEELEESERRFRLLVAGVQDYAIFMMDPEGHIQSWNEGAQRIKGYTEQEIVGRHFSAFYTDQDRERRHPQWELEVARREGRYEEEGWRVRKDGTTFWANVVITAIRGDDGDLIGFAKVTRDLTERKRLEDERRREAERYRAIYEDNPSIYLTTDSSGIIIEVNRFGAEYLGYQVDELVGMPATRLVLEADRGRFLEQIGAALQHPGETHYAEFRKLHRSGRLIWVRESARAIATDGELVVLNVCEDITERVAADAERREVLERERDAREEITRILESITDAFFALDREWRFTYLNRGARRVVEGVLGRDAEEVVGTSFWDVVPQFRGTRFETEYRRAMTEQQPAHFEEFAPAFDVWFEVHAYPSPDGLSVYFRDVSERKRAEEALRRSEEQFRAIAENIHEVFWIADPDFTSISYVSPAYQRVYGRSLESLYADPRSFIDAVHPEDRERLERALAEMHGGGLDVEYRIRRADDSVRWIWARGFPVCDEQGQIERMVGISEDITGRKRAEQTYRFLAEAGEILASSLDYEQTLANVARLAVSELADWCIIDLCEEGEIRRVAVVTGDPAREELTRRYQDLYPPEPDAPTGGPFVIRTGEPQLIAEVSDETLRAAARDESHLETLRQLGLRSLISVPLRARDRVLGAVTLISSQTARRFGPDDVRLAELLADRAALSMDKARLFREARAASEIRDEVLSIVSHDLRNPLNTILMSSSFLCETLPEEENAAVLKQLRIIQRAARQGSRLIEDLLDIARLEAGRLTLEAQPQNPRVLVMEACESFRTLAEEKQIRFECNAEADLPTVHADRDRILQVFSNLIGNAIKFTPAGGEIDVHASLVGNTVQFSVRDTGAGIPAEDQPHLFNRFYQARNSRRGGAGLGLAIARGIVEGHGGRIWVESRLGEGSEFFFCLPREESRG